MWGDGHEDRGMAGDVKKLKEDMDQIKGQYKFALGGLSGVNCVLGLLYLYLKLRGA